MFARADYLPTDLGCCVVAPQSIIDAHDGNPVTIVDAQLPIGPPERNLEPGGKWAT